MNEQEIKYRIRLLNKQKKATKVGTQARRDINDQIRELKNKLNLYSDDETKNLIKEIYKLKPEYKKIKLNLKKFTKEELEKHLNKLKEKNK
jgi:repressor of nif and glnA expression